MGRPMEIVKIPVEGKVIKEISEDHVVFTDGAELDFYHVQDCCENVRVADIIGDLDDHVGAVVVLIEEVHDEPDADDPVRKVEDLRPGHSISSLPVQGTLLSGGWVNPTVTTVSVWIGE